MIMDGVRIHISGIVQGVGFRPFVYGLAVKHGLVGWVRNSSAGVDIEVDGNRAILEGFIAELRNEAPVLAQIDSLDAVWTEPNGFKTFIISPSEDEPSKFQPVSPDVCICSDCLSELFDPNNRRYRYPFINCTNCGPRFTIVQDIPYDRANTTMAGFTLCPECSTEYHDPLNRRFHAQPVACSTCGPQVWLEQGSGGEVVSRYDDAIRTARRWLLEGKILAIKGLGGFHLACDFTNLEAVAELRKRKLRVDKAFALMASDIHSAGTHCLISPREREQMERRERPIVIVRRSAEFAVAPQVAPGQDTLGLMLPYTPLHYLLFADPDMQPVQYNLPPLVMTSANLSDEPICTDNAEARERLVSLADGYLMHDRNIHMRCDDSVVRIFPVSQSESARDRGSVLCPIRRARGFTPAPLRLDIDTRPLLAVGAELKNTFCLTCDHYAFVSQHIGDLENLETMVSFETAVKHYERLFRIKPEAIACDLHPDYLATCYAEQRASQEGLPLLGVQHHHAHIAACMAENGLKEDESVIGVSFDGTGYGDDGAIWGGEFLLSNYLEYQRIAHLAYVPLPGGDLAVREPWRMALAWLRYAEIDWQSDLPPVQFAMEKDHLNLPILDAIQHQLELGLNAPKTSSIGRLFDAAASLCGICHTVNYEAQAAIEFEALSDISVSDDYPLEMSGQVIDAAPLFHSIVFDLRKNIHPSIIAARFHNSLANMVQRICRDIRDERGVEKIALSGGVWQNNLLLSRTVELLQAHHFDIYLHRQVPANDGGLSLGQAAVAAAHLKKML